MLEFLLEIQIIRVPVTLVMKEKENVRITWGITGESPF